MPTAHLLIKGKVQGVFYRATARKIANEMGITGWARNTSEGDVEVMATGKQEVLDRFIVWCRRGPEMAAVTDVIISKMAPAEFKGFAISRGNAF
jgi:acylphosphatase